MTSLKLRMYAFALNLSAERREALTEWGDRLTIIYSESRDPEKIAQLVMAEASTKDETGFLCHAFDVALSRRLKTPYRGRAIIFTWLSRRCEEIAEMRQRFANAWRRVTAATEIVEGFAALESAHPGKLLDARLLPPASRGAIWKAIKDQAEAYKELRDIDPEAFVRAGCDLNVKRLLRLLSRLHEVEPPSV